MKAKPKHGTVMELGPITIELKTRQRWTMEIRHGKIRLYYANVTLTLTEAAFAVYFIQTEE